MSCVLPDPVLQRARSATPEDPLRVVVSACLLGQPTGFDGSSWPQPPLLHLAGLPNARVLGFCPEDFGLGTPRPWMAIRDGDGDAVLDGLARIVDLTDADVTDGFLLGASEMVRRAGALGAELAILMDTSPSCATHVLHRQEAWPDRAYRAGPGVTAAALRRAGVPCIAQRDHASLHALLHALDPAWEPDPSAWDVPDDPWFRANLA